MPLECQFLSHWYDSTPKKSLRKRDSNPGSSALEADTLPLGQRDGGISGIRTRDLPLSRRTPKPLSQRGGERDGVLTTPTLSSVCTACTGESSESYHSQSSRYPGVQVTEGELGTASSSSEVIRPHTPLRCPHIDWLSDPGKEIEFPWWLSALAQHATDLRDLVIIIIMSVFLEHFFM